MGKIATRGLYLCALTFACVGLAFGQARQVTGTVTDAGSNFPLPGVNISVQGTTTGTTTGIDGRYSIQVPGADAVLVYSFVGYETQQIPVGAQEVINVSLVEDVALLEDVVVIGYGTQRREDITGSVASIQADDAKLALAASPVKMMQGRVAGVSIVQNNGEPGAGFKVRIRGGASISASNEPLYVIDGVPVSNAATEPGGGSFESSARSPLNLINPNDIASLTVLKDASATAIYGSRGANGVILIETKKGQAGRVTVDYEGSVSSSALARKLDLLDGDAYRSYVRQQVQSNAEYNKLLENLGDHNTDWQDAVTRNAISQFHNLAFSGGATNTQYRASVSYLDQQGIILSSGLERVTGRLNASHSTWDNRLRIDMNVNASHVSNDYGPLEETSGFEGGLLHNVIGFNPTQPVYNADGSYYEQGTGRQGIRNPVALAEQLDDFGVTKRTLGNLAAELELVRGLKAKINVGADQSSGNRRWYFPAQSPVGAEWNGRAIQRNLDLGSKTFQSYLTFNRPLVAGHHLDLVGGYEFSEYTKEEFGAETRDFVTDYWRYNNLNGGKLVDKAGVYSLKETRRLVSFFGRANYNLRERYYLTGVLRYDGSSVFGANNKWALFPAVSAAWRISQERFMQDFDFISDLRLRLGFGIQGNEAIDPYGSLALLRPDAGARAVLGDGIVTGVAPTTYANPNLKWEESQQFNIGLDYGFMNGKYSGTIEYYLRNTYDLLLEVDVPQPAVVSTRIENVGELKNQGLEFSLDALAVDRRDMSVILGVVFSAERNEVTKLRRDGDRIYTGDVSGRGQSGVTSEILQVGSPVPSFYGYEFVGIENGVQVFNDYELDASGNQVLRGTTIDPNENDRRVIGNPRPDFSVGFRTQATWKNVDLSFFLRGEFGRDVFNNTALVYQTQSSVLQNNNMLADAITTGENFTEAAKFSSRWIEDGSFLRLQNVTLGYTLNLASLTSRVRNARIFVSADNLFVITPYKGYDPEVNTDAGLASLGIDWLKYPTARTVAVGVSVGF